MLSPPAPIRVKTPGPKSRYIGGPFKNTAGPGVTQSLDDNDAWNISLDELGKDGLGEKSVVNPEPCPIPACCDAQNGVLADNSLVLMLAVKSTLFCFAEALPATKMDAAKKANVADLKNLLFSCIYFPRNGHQTAAPEYIGE